jgi:hypothetical protein
MAKHAISWIRKRDVLRAGCWEELGSDVIHTSLSEVYQIAKDLAKPFQRLLSRNRMVSEPGAVATGSGGTIEIERDFLIRSLPLAVLTRKLA